MRVTQMRQVKQQPELRLWRAALVYFIRDEEAYLLTSKKHRLNKVQLEAFNDLCACGGMTRRLCNSVGYNPVWLSEKFRKRVKEYYGAEE